MLLMQWIFFIFVLLEILIEKQYSLAKTNNSSTEVENETQNLTFTNKKVNRDKKKHLSKKINGNGNGEGEIQISDMIPANQGDRSHQTDRGRGVLDFVTPIPKNKHNKKANSIKIHCCKRNNSIIECKHDDFKYIIKLNNNKLNQNQVGTLVRSIYRFVDTLTKNCMQTDLSPVLQNYQTLNDTENFSKLKNLETSRMSKYNSSNLPISDDNKILQSNNSYTNITNREVKKFSGNKHNRIIECSLIKKFSDDTGITGLPNLKAEPMLKLSCRLIGDKILQPKTFTIPVAINYPQSKINQRGENIFFMNSLRRATNEHLRNSNRHNLRKRNSKREYRHSTENDKTFNKKEETNDSNDKIINEVDKNAQENNNNNSIENNAENNTDYEENKAILADEPNDTIKSKFQSVKEWVSTLKDKTSNQKKYQNAGQENEKQSQFLFHTKQNNSLDEDETSTTSKSEKNIKNKEKHIENVLKKKQTISHKNNKNTTEGTLDKMFRTLDDYSSTEKSITKQSANHKNYHRSSSTTERHEDYDENISTRSNKKGSSFSTISKHKQTHSHSKVSATTDNLADMVINISSADVINDNDNDSDEDEDDDNDNDMITESASINTITSYTSHFGKRLKNNKNNHANMIGNNKSKIFHTERGKKLIENKAKSLKQSSTTSHSNAQGDGHSKHRPDKRIKGNLLPRTKENFNLEKKEVSKVYNRHNSPKIMKSTAEDDDEEEENEEDYKHDDEEYEDNPGKIDDKKKIVSLKTDNHRLSGLINSNKGNEYKHIEKNRQDDNRRKRLFDYISNLKKSKKQAAENFVK